MGNIWQEARIALRGFRRSPTFTVTAVLILGLGIGMAAAMWTVCDAVLIHPLPVRDAARVVLLRTVDRGGLDVSFAQPEVVEIARSSRTMREVAGMVHWQGPTAGPLLDHDHPIVLRQILVTGNFFDVLGAKPAIGRLLRSEDDSSSRAIVLSYGVWQRDFGGDPSVVGRQFLEPFDRRMYTVVGVAPPGLDYPVGVDVWRPIPGEGAYPLNVVARLAPQATMAAAETELLSIARPIVGRRWVPIDVVRATGRTLRDGIMGDARPVIVLLTAAVGLLLVITCVNVGNLLLLRASVRARELAVRRSLGATRSDIVRQLLVESAVLAAGGAALGLVVDHFARRALVAAAPAQLPRLDLVTMAGAPVITTLSLAMLTTLAFGVLPALAVAGQSLRLDERAATTTRRRRHVRQLLVASQVALALVMLAGAGLLGKSLARLEHLDLGYRKDHITMMYAMPPADDSVAQVWRLCDALSARIRAIPGVVAVTPTMFLPFVGPNMWVLPLETEGQAPLTGGVTPAMPVEVAGPDYFRVFGIPMIRGRAFLDTDRDGTPPVAIVSEAAARLFWGNADPIGKRFRIRNVDPWWTVVGVVGDTHLRVLRETTPLIYFPERQYYWQGVFAIRSSASASASTLLPYLRRAVNEVDPTVTLWSVHTMDEYLSEPLAEPRLSALLIAAFGLVALTLAAIGLYGIMASAVREQTRDIGVRMALGATPARIRADVLRRALVISLVGAAVGVLVALAASRILTSLLFRVSPTDPVALLGACGVLLAVAAVAAFLPAYHASRVDPARALQTE